MSIESDIEVWAKSTAFKPVFNTDCPGVLFYTVVSGGHQKLARHFRKNRDGLRFIRDAAKRELRHRHSRALADNNDPGSWHLYLAAASP